MGGTHNLVEHSYKYKLIYKSDVTNNRQNVFRSFLTNWEKTSFFSKFVKFNFEWSFLLKNSQKNTYTYLFYFYLTLTSPCLAEATKSAYTVTTNDRACHQTHSDHMNCSFKMPVFINKLYF